MSTRFTKFTEIAKESDETPSDLCEIETRLRSFRPKRVPELVYSLSFFTMVSDERVPYPVTFSTFHQFTRFVRNAQLKAGLFGGLLGLLLGTVLGGLCVFGTMNRPMLRESLGMFRQAACASTVCSLVTTPDCEIPLAAQQICHYYRSVLKETRNYSQ
ncbi:MAG: hypothetical protein LBQ50_05580 [Planctomycetaceae bacterium]|jgi:hypothetical protein|nr:hypothetical protein [Planctomycetaceae bacterium]